METVMEVLTSVDGDLMLDEKFDLFGKAFDATVRTIIDGASVEATQESLAQLLHWQTAILQNNFTGLRMPSLDTLLTAWFTSSKDEYRGFCVAQALDSFAGENWGRSAPIDPNIAVSNLIETVARHHSGAVLNADSVGAHLIDGFCLGSINVRAEGSHLDFALKHYQSYHLVAVHGLELWEWHPCQHIFKCIDRLKHLVNCLLAKLRDKAFVEVMRTDGNAATVQIKDLITACREEVQYIKKIEKMIREQMEPGDSSDQYDKEMSETLATTMSELNAVAAARQYALSLACVVLAHAVSLTHAAEIYAWSVMNNARKETLAVA
jgi:hypothetical protein